jgi:uncharacterized membrane protein
LYSAGNRDHHWFGFNEPEKRKDKMNKRKGRIVPAVVVLAILVFALTGAVSVAAADRKTVVDQDLVIQISDLSSTVQFYPVTIGGTKMEVLAVEAPDGTIRTAFNTCQVCYSSGRGYYKQSGTYLICQNCGNRFRMSQVEIASGGCNPVPIFPANKTVDAEKIVISKEYLQKAKGIFAQWRR